MSTTGEGKYKRDTRIIVFKKQLQKVMDQNYLTLYISLYIIEIKIKIHHCFYNEGPKDYKEAKGICE